jgi:AraC-like DNA-binding protein
MRPAAADAGHALSGRVVLRTASLDAARAHLSPLLTAHRLERVQAMPALDFEHRQASFGGLSLHQIRYAASVRLDALDAPDFYLLQLTLAGRACACIDGQVVVAGPGEFMVVNAGRPHTKWWEPETEQVMLRIDRARLQAALGEGRAQRPGRPLPRFLPRAIPAATVPALRGLLGAAIADLNGPCLLARPGFGRQVADVLVAALAESLPMVVAPGAASPAAPASVRRAEAFMKAHLDQELDLAQVAAAAGVSVRGIQAGFRRFRDATPMGHLRALRLDRARMLLAQRGGAVAEVAAACGFRHLGRFAMAYARRFGKRPTETRRRRR